MDKQIAPIMYNKLKHQVLWILSGYLIQLLQQYLQMIKHIYLSDY